MIEKQGVEPVYRIQILHLHRYISRDNLFYMVKAIYIMSSRSKLLMNAN